MTQRELKSPGAFSRRAYGVALLLAAITFLVYWPSLKSGFVYDAPLEIQEGFFTNIANLPDVLSLKVLGMPIMLADRPAQLLYLMLIAAVSSTNPFGYHLCDNLLHAANVALLFLLLVRLALAEMGVLYSGQSRRVLLAGAVAVLIFAVHPLAVEPVSAINYSSDLLVTFFTLLTLLAATAFTPTSIASAWIMGIAGTVCAFAAVASKESGVAAAALLIVYWFLYRRHEAKGPWLAFLGAAVAVTVAFLAAMFLLAPPVPANNTAGYPGGSFLQALTIQPRLWVFMMGKIVWPVSLSADYTPENIGDLGKALAATILGLVVYLQAWLAMKSRIGGFGVAIYWLGLATVSNFIPLHRVLGDRFYYLPLAGVAAQVLALVLMTLRSRDGFWGVVIPCLIALLPLATACVLRQGVFSSELTLWSDTVQISPASSIAHCNLGVALGQAGQLDGAIAQLQQGLAINPRRGEFHNNLGNALLLKGEVPEAIAEYQKALAIAPNAPSTHVNLGNALLKTGQLDEAKAEYKEALRLNPNYADAQDALAQAMLTPTHTSPPSPVTAAAPNTNSTAPAP